MPKGLQSGRCSSAHSSCPQTAASAGERLSSAGGRPPSPPLRRAYTYGSHSKGIVVSHNDDSGQVLSTQARQPSLRRDNL